MSRFRVLVTLKPGLLDSAGRAVGDSLNTLGFSGVSGVRMGKLIEVDLIEGGREEVEEMCKKLLANPVIEEYSIEAVS